MQTIDCRNFKEMLDSYLCQELAVETNHTMLHHAEHCAQCRTELAARRQLRESLQRACAQDCLSEEAIERLRARLRAEAGAERVSDKTARWREIWARLFTPSLALPALAVSLLLLVFGAASFYLLRGSGQTVKLSAALLDEAAHDHRFCAVKFINADGATMPTSVVNYDAALLGLEQVADSGAAGLQLRHAHVCQPGARRFAHLVYTKDAQLISLLVTQRDARALASGELPTDGATWTGLEQAARPQLALGAYQTARRVVLVVSDLPEAENKILTERLALPVVEHLRRAESQTASLKFARVERRDLLVSATGGELR